MKNHNVIKYASKIQGCIFGVAIGDALGMPSEGLSKNEIIEKYGIITDYTTPKNHFRNILEAGEYTDDTEQTICIIKSITKDGFNKDIFINELINWYKNNPVGIGPTSQKSIEYLINNNYNGVDSKTCGAAMRVSPLGLYYYDNIEELKTKIIESSKLTHNNNEAIAGALAIGYIVSYCFKYCGDMSSSYLDKNRLLMETSNFIKEFSVEFAEKINHISNLKSIEEGYKLFGTGMDAIECVPSAILTFYLTDDFKTGMIYAVNAGGDTDSLGSIYGAIAGTCYGINSIPKKWIDGIKNKNYLMNLADYLTNLMNK